MIIDDIHIYLAEFPLKGPYMLSFGSVNELKSVLVMIRCGDSIGWGESTPLPGYTEDTEESVYADTMKISRGIIGTGCERALEKMERYSGFGSAAVRTALEMVSGSLDFSGERKKVPLVYTLKGLSRDELMDDIDDGTRQGCRTFKYKVGKDPILDKETANFIVDNIPAEGKIRFDANQGYEFDEAKLFADGIRNKTKVQCFEQPLDVPKWGEMTELSRSTSLPLMLDESIRATEDITRTAELGCAEYIKLKLFKCGGIQRMIDMAGYASAKGLKVIVGNGVSTALGCFFEAKVQENIGLSFAGEMNGYLKLADNIINTVKWDKGNMDFLDVEVSGHMDERLIDKCSIRKRKISA